MRSLFILGAALTLGVASPALAQDEGTVDVGLFLRATMPDDGLTDKMPLGGGGRLGLFLKRNIALEFDASRSETEKASYTLMMPFAARLAYHHPFTENWTGIIGAGWVREYIDPPGAGGRWPDDGVTALVGIQRRLSGRSSLRIDGIMEQFVSPIGETLANDIEHTHLAVQFGIVWRFRDSDAPPPPPVVMPAPVPAPAPTPVPAPAPPPPPPDTDRDGVIDANDACANTPAGTRVDASGCAIPVDSDRDGVMDNADRCANTPAGTRVDANGCAIPVDTDGDGVMDNADACANTARGTPVDARGCARIFEEGKANIVLEGVTFATGSAMLTDGAKVVLDKMAETLNGAPDLNVEVQGHTDNTGSAANNTRLSGLRAEAVRTYLVSKGVNAARLTAKGYGPTVPVADNATPAGRSQNRRVELKKTN